MPIKVTISLMRETRNLRILDRYDNNRQLYPPPGQDAKEVSLPPEITLDSVTTNGASPPVGKLQMKCELLERDDQGKEEWVRVDRPFTVTAGKHTWPRDGLVAHVRSLFERWSPTPPKE
ncbi:MAG TPA: hypothetical protein VFN28_12180 [Amaricoccus sp.]|jgi:hypothetical protein|nr:hypothetical protein [Amaricoccus sp.]